MIDIQANTTRTIELTASPAEWQTIADRARECAEGRARRENNDSFLFFTEQRGEYVFRFRVDRRNGVHG